MFAKLIATAVLALAAVGGLTGTASADIETTGRGSRVLSNALVIAPVSVPTNACANNIHSTGRCHGDSEVEVAD
ncbi:chaplin [Actinomadura craniellae]|uniref:Chaplin n=1 Tax=Actinomadura craniellae TaxID=2231787 RepID=A0A365H9R0_9ACTN|nr:chaplin [Actinomadura craniellae]RAY15884.1 chaplin [Actinomadura craniellae]